jgi:hypothetical protein
MKDFILALLLFLAVEILSIVIADMTHTVGILKTLNNYAPLIQAVASVIAVIVTAVLVWITLRYARSTHKMQKIMEKQILAEIELYDLCLRTNINEMGKYIPDKEPDIKCKVSFDIYNKNSGNGSIKKPELFLRSRNNDFELSIPTYIRTGDDEQKSIFLRGGEYRPVELSYLRVISGNSNQAIRENMQKKIFTPQNGVLSIEIT